VSTTTISGQVWDVAVAGDRAFVAGGDNGVHVFDISDLTSPLILGSVQTHSALGVAVSGGKLFVADGLGGLLILIHSPTGPTLQPKRRLCQVRPGCRDTDARQCDQARVFVIPVFRNGERAAICILGH
jgi:hypothetical protein